MINILRLIELYKEADRHPTDYLKDRVKEFDDVQLRIQEQYSTIRKRYYSLDRFLDRISLILRSNFQRNEVINWEQKMIYELVIEQRDGS